ncbi:MAG: SCO family protein [Gammaproteobacteria bacterium]|nr:SCO family protein [Gammaproteobacteria bacterium]MBT7308143.1 SCO family protein [Gammaproteobacteria bacterium]
MRYLILMGAILLTAGCEPPAPPVMEGATVLPTPRVLQPFQLSHHALGKFGPEQIAGNWTLFFFGYTRCPDVCPTELYTLAEMMRRIEKSPGSVEPPQVTFVSVDPQQDLPGELQRYAGFYHPSFLGVTAEQAEVDRFARNMGAMYERVYFFQGKELIIDPDEGVPEGLENGYLINHSATIFLTNPKGELHAIFSTPHQPDSMVRDLAAIQSAW